MTNESDTLNQPSGTQSRPRRLHRSADEKVIAGVAGGLGEYFGLDPVVFRIAFVVLALAGASGVLLYVLAWALLPRQDQERSAVQDALENPGRGKKVAAAVLLAIGIVSLAGETRLFRHGGAFLAVVLIGAGLAVLFAPDRSGSGHGGPGNHGGPTGHTGGPAGDPDGPGPQTSPPGAPVPAADSSPGTGLVLSPPASPPVPPPPKGRSVTAMVSSLLLVGGGVAFLAGAPAKWVLSVSLLVVGAGLLVGSRWGRSRGLIPVGLLLVAALGVVSVVDFLDVSVSGDTGQRLEHPVTLADLRPSYRQSAGQLTLDLTDVDLAAAGGTSVVEARIGAGELKVIVPSDADVVVDAKVGVGDLVILDEKDDGIDVSRRVVRQASTDVDGPDLRLHLRAGVGQVEVRRAA